MIDVPTCTCSTSKWMFGKWLTNIGVRTTILKKGLRFCPMCGDELLPDGVAIARNADASEPAKEQAVMAI